MEESLINLVEKFNSQSLEDNRGKIRINIYKEIEELRNNDEFSRIIEIGERDFFSNLIRYKESRNTKLEKLFNLYECLEKLKINIESFKYFVNKE